MSTTPSSARLPLRRPSHLIVLGSTILVYTQLRSFLIREIFGAKTGEVSGKLGHVCTDMSAGKLWTRPQPVPFAECVDEMKKVENLESAGFS